MIMIHMIHTTFKFGFQSFISHYFHIYITLLTFITIEVYKGGFIQIASAKVWTNQGLIKTFADGRTK